MKKPVARLLVALATFVVPTEAITALPTDTILFASSVSREERAYIMEQSFASRWQARDPGIMIFNYRFAGYSFPPSAGPYTSARS